MDGNVRTTDVVSKEPGPKPAPTGVPSRSGKKHNHGFWKWSLLVVAVILIAGRLYLPGWITTYVNQVLQRNSLYQGRIEQIGINLWRGAYEVRGIHISKTSGSVPVPFLTVKRLELSLEWRALLKGSLVGQAVIEEPVINFVDSSSERGRQTGGEGAWMGMLENLFPFRINSVELQNGSIHWRSYEQSVPLNVYLSRVHVSVKDLTNVRDETRPLFATIDATATAMNQAKCECHIQLDPSSYAPTFHLKARILGLDVTLLNEFATHYGALDFERGWFDFVVEADAKSGALSGYAKALFRQLRILDLKSDFADGKILEGIWQGILSAATFLFKNHERDQFGTLIPFQGTIAGSTSSDFLAIVLNLLRNAFIEAYLPRYEGRPEEQALLEFDNPQFDDRPIDLNDEDKPLNP